MRERSISSIFVYGCIVFIAVIVMDNWCLIERIFGIPCPGCNMFTAIYWLICRGNITYANYYHPMVIPLLVYCLLCFLLFLYQKAAFLDCRAFKIMSCIFIVMFIGVWIYRMVTIFPNSPMYYNENAICNQLFHLL